MCAHDGGTAIDHPKAILNRTPGLSRRCILAGALGVGAVGLLGVVKAGPANAATPRPSIIGCSTWGAQAARGAIVMTGPPQKILVHHTASGNTTDYSLGAAYSVARSIQSYHFSRGWPDTGQQFTISRGGYTLEGRHRSVEGLGSGSSRVFPLGAHCTGQNSTSIGIENEGTYTSALPTSAQWNALVALCAYLCQTYGLTASNIYGHRDFGNTECPGTALYARLPQLRADVAAKLGTSPPPSPNRPWPVLEQGSTGFRVLTAQYLLRHSGRSLEVDSSFGPGTRSAVVAFQQSKGLTADGVIGQRTWESPLAVTCRSGDSSDAVRGVQSALASRGYSVTRDGSFGPATASAVRGFQTGKGLTPDGVVGPDTWSNLLA